MVRKKEIDLMGIYISLLIFLELVGQIFSELNLNSSYTCSTGMYKFYSNILYQNA